MVGGAASGFLLMNNSTKEWLKVVFACVTCVLAFLGVNYPIMRVVIRDVVREELDKDTGKYMSKEVSTMLWTSHEIETREIRSRIEEKIASIETDTRNIKRIMQGPKFVEPKDGKL